MTLVTVVVSPRRPTPRRLDKEKEELLGQLLAGDTGSRCLDTLLLAVSKQLRMDDGPVLRSGLTLSTETGLKVPRSKIGRPPPSILFRFSPPRLSNPGTPRQGKSLKAVGLRQPYQCGDDGIICPFRTLLRRADDWLPLGSECCWLSPSFPHSSIRFSFPPHAPSSSIIILLFPPILF